MAESKQPQWQKRQKFAEVFGDRSHLEIADKIFERARSLKKSRGSEPGPIFLEDNPSKGTFFPVSIKDLTDVLAGMPAVDIADITHIWLRRPKPSEFRGGKIPFTEYVCVDGINVIIIYPWPENMLFTLNKKPANAVMNQYRVWSPELFSRKGKWYLEWNAEVVQDFYLTHLLPHEISHHVNFQKRNWSKTNLGPRHKSTMQYANQSYFEETVIFRS